MNRISAVLLAWGAAALVGCGTGITSDYPNRLVGVDGQIFVLEDLEDITDISDADLDNEGKRALFRDLGIEDEELIDALLGL